MESSSVSVGDRAQGMREARVAAGNLVPAGDVAASNPLGRGLTASRSASRPRRQPLVIIAIAAIVGIVLDRYGPPYVAALELSSLPDGGWMAIWWYVALCLLCGWWIAWRARRETLAAWLLVGSVAFTGAAWHDAAWYLFSRDELARYADSRSWGPTCIEGVAAAGPERLAAPPSTPLRAIPAGERSRLLVEAVAIRDGRRWRPASGACEVVTEGHLLGVASGDRVQVFGQLGRPMPPRNPGEFDFRAHARADRHLVRIRSTAPECMSVIGDGTRWSWRHLLDRIRGGGQQILRRYVGPERAGLASAILLGAREGLHREETTAYLATGTVHLLVVSGLNVGILAAGLYGAMQVGWLSRRMGLAAIILVVLAYTLLTRGEPPVPRAAVLAVLLCIAAWTGRQAAAFNSLGAAAIIVLALNPAELFRPGTQLSFLCVATLVWMGNRLPASPPDLDRLDQLLAAARPWHARWGTAVGRWGWWLLVTTLVVWLASLPLVLHEFHVVSPVAVPISPPVWLVVFVAMWSGFFLLAFGWIWQPLAAVLGTVCDVSLAGLEQVVEWAEAVPAGHSWWPGPAWWWVVGFYIGLLTVMIRGRALAAPRWQVAALAAWIVIGLVPSATRAVTRSGLDVAFLSVGHGTCVLFEGPDGETLLYDAGSLGSPDYATQTIASYLWHRGLRRIDGIVLSHADIDHFNAVPGLLERFDVGTIYVSPVMFSGFGAGGAFGPAVVRETIEDAGIPLREVWAGDKLRIGSHVTATVMHPPRRGIVGNDNANSITLAIEYDGRRVLLPGDLESPGLEDVIAELPYDCDVLLAPHHGSGQSDPPGFAAWSMPEWVVVSGGQELVSRPVLEAYERAGAGIASTFDSGTIEFAIRSGAIRGRGWLDQN